ncbi:MAG: ABC transporter permease, partial [Acidobacteriota bacterium]
MSGLRAAWSRLLGMWGSGQARLDEELREHTELLAAEYERGGMTAEQARAAALREIGNTTQIREKHREQARLPWFDALGQDIRYTLRQWRVHPGFAATAIVTLALGIGANAAIFQLLDVLVLRPLPVRDPGGLVIVQGYWSDSEQGFSYPLLREMSTRQDVVEGIFASTEAPVRKLTIEGRTPELPVQPGMATGNYFRTLGTGPQLGRLFEDRDDAGGAVPVAVLSDGFWRREFGGQPSAVGRVLNFNGVAFTIVGITRPEFFGERVGQAPDFWVPLSFADRVWSPGMVQASSIWLSVMARLKPGVTRERAEQQLAALWSELRSFSIQTNGEIKYRLQLKPGEQGLGTLHKQYSRSLWLLMGIVALVALIACSNLANLLLARASARTHEIGVRLAIGARRARLIRQMLTESIVVALAGGALGLGLAELASQQLVRLASAGETWQLPIHLDWRVAGFTLGVSLTAAVIFGLAPAFSGSRLSLTSALQMGRRTHTGGASRLTATRAFVVGQIALSLVLVAGASLLVRSFWQLTHQDFGFEPHGVLVAPVTVTGGDFKEMFDADVLERVSRRIREIPGVVAGGAAVPGLLTEGARLSGGPVAIEDGPTNVVMVTTPVSTGYLETMKIQVLRGRGITADDKKESPHVAVITETAASALFGKQDPIGKKFSPGRQMSPRFTFEVVGVVRDARYSSPTEPFRPLAFVPRVQYVGGTPPTIVLRTEGDPMRYADALQKAVTEVAPSLKLARTTTFDAIIRRQARQELLLAWLSGGFGLLALVLAAVGLYGVIAYAAERRMQEMGVRMALGATDGQVLGLLLREVIVLLAVGLGIGGAATFVMGRSLESLLFGLS